MIQCGIVTFYAVDGMDGAGKSTVAGFLRDELESSGRKVCLIEHPNRGWFIGRISAGCLLRTNVLSGAIVTLSFFADLIHSVFRMKCASSYDDYIFVRYTMSVCYLPDHLCRFLRFCLRLFFMKPDVAVLVDVPAEEALRRIDLRGQTKEIFENADRLVSAGERMRTMAAEEGWTVIDNTGDGVRDAVKVLVSTQSL